MINLNQAFDIDWEATSDNLRMFCQATAPIEEIALVMGKDRKTIQNWCRNRNRPPLEDLAFLCKIFGCSLEDILVFSYQTHDFTVTEEERRNYDSEIKENPDYQKKSEKYHCTDYYCPVAEDIISDIYLREILSRGHQITMMEEFLIYMPIMNLKKLSDVLWHLQGNIERDRFYCLDQLARLYYSTEPSPAKEYADFLREYVLTYPKINMIDDNTKRQDKIEKSKKYLELIKTEKYDQMKEAYDEKLNGLLAMLEDMHLSFFVTKITEPDGSITLDVMELNITVNEETEILATDKLAKLIISYFENFDSEYKAWLSAGNRKDHYHYAKRVLKLDDIKKVKELFYSYEIRKINP